MKETKQETRQEARQEARQETRQETLTKVRHEAVEEIQRLVVHKRAGASEHVPPSRFQPRPVCRPRFDH